MTKNDEEDLDNKRTQGATEAVNWSLRSCDLTSLEHFLRGSLKDKCYADAQETIYHLKVNIRAGIGGIMPHKMENLLKNFVDRIGYMSEIVFHH